MFFSELDHGSCCPIQIEFSLPDDHSLGKPVDVSSDCNDLLEDGMMMFCRGTGISGIITPGFF